MRAMVLTSAGGRLEQHDLPDPRPGPGELLIAVSACGVCRTDLHILDGELPPPRLPLVLGHQIVGTVRECGAGVDEGVLGRRVGVPWLARTCGHCRFCTSKRENLCDHAEFTGFSRDGGFATLAVADARFCHELPDSLEPAQAAPLLCAGLIGYRCLRAAGDARRLGLYGFGAAAHIVAQIAHDQGREVYAFVRPGDEAAERFATRLGVDWVGGSDRPPPVPLDAAIIFAPVGRLVLDALAAVDKGGSVICGGIHMSEIPPIPYRALWNERSIRSVANLTRDDGKEFFSIARKALPQTTVEPFPLSDANEALERLRAGWIDGAAVLRPPS